MPQYRPNRSARRWVELRVYLVLVLLLLHIEWEAVQLLVNLHVWALIVVRHFYSNTISATISIDSDAIRLCSPPAIFFLFGSDILWQKLLGALNSIVRLHLACGFFSLYYVVTFLNFNRFTVYQDIFRLFLFTTLLVLLNKVLYFAHLLGRVLNNLVTLIKLLLELV